MTGQPPPTSSPHAYRYPRAMRENGSQQNPYGSRVLGRHRGRERSHSPPPFAPRHGKSPICRGLLVRAGLIASAPHGCQVDRKCGTANYVLRARHGIGPPHPNGVDGRSGGAVSENGMDVSEEETSRARNAVAA